jgi:polysaccharide export outer membrane protein
MVNVKTACLLGFCLYLTSALKGQTVGPAPTQPYQPPPPASGEVLNILLRAQVPVILLQKDDVISVKVFDLPELQTEQRVNEDGVVYFPLLGPIRAAGRSLTDVQTTIAEELVSKRLVAEPQVSVTALSLPSRTIALTGEFNKPGVFPAYGALRLSDCIALGQGFDTMASRGIVLRRASLPSPISIPLGPDLKTSAYGDIPVFPGDAIEAPRTGVVYAVGAFKVQGAYPIKSGTPTTADQLLALAGGIGYEASANDAQILRVKDGKYILIPIPLGKIEHGKQADVPLQSDDVLFVPTNALRAGLKGGGAGLIVSLATSFLLINH